MFKVCIGTHLMGGYGTTTSLVLLQGAHYRGKHVGILVDGLLDLLLTTARRQGLEVVQLEIVELQHLAVHRGHLGGAGYHAAAGAGDALVGHRVVGLRGGGHVLLLANYTVGGHRLRLLRLGDRLLVRGKVLTLHCNTGSGHIVARLLGDVAGAQGERFLDIDIECITVSEDLSCGLYNDKDR